jgi:sugar/nucleoside kinase (ribokinase family)
VRPSLRDGYLEEIIRFLKAEAEEPDVVVMPDFFLDRLISLSFDARTFSKQLKQVIERKGGSLDGVEQHEMRGGNAINTASALASLGAKVVPIVCVDKFGLQLIKFHLKSAKVNLSHIKIFRKPSITTAIEFETKNGKVNVMLRDLGALADFGPQNLDENDFEAIEKADYVCVFNWAGTRHFGTKLAKDVFRHVKTRGKGKTYLDTADPYPNKKKIQEMVRNVLHGKHVDILSLNENEAICYASQLNNEITQFKTRLKYDELAMKSARILASHLSARIDLHTTSFSATINKKSETVVSTFKVPVLRATGAGDAWNAGNILGDAHRLSDGSRLALANAVATYYISCPEGTHPTRRQLIKFCERLKQKRAHT